jgi:hypothetical protein
MENRNSRSAPTPTPFAPIFEPSVLSKVVSDATSRYTSRKPRVHAGPSFALRLSIFGVVLLAGCGAPGDPTAPSPPVPTTISDLSARQAGDGVQLTFSMPTKTIRGERLASPPAVEVLRGAAKPDGSPDPNSFRVIDTIPGALVKKYQIDEHTQIVSPVAPEESRAHPGATILYRVRTRASKKRASADSNPVTVHIFPVPQQITAIACKVNETSMELSWSAVTRTSGGDPVVVSEYHIYRGELDARTHDPSTKDVLHEKWIVPLALLASSDAPNYRDTQFDFGKTYVYLVRSVTTASGNPLESSDSDPLVLTPVDVFPPATPQEVAVAILLNPGTGATEVDLSWSINAEPDLAGYRVYRSEQQEDKGQLVTPDLLLSPAYRDTSVAPGHQYWYRVSAVDRSGNESAPTPPAAADIAQHSP